MIREMTKPTRILSALALLAIVASAAVLAACGSSGAGNPDSKLTESQAKEKLPAGAPPQLASIRGQANEILDGGTDAFDARLAELKGTPVVVNKWASWCGPCRLEFPELQTEASKRGGDVAFLGVLSDDAKDTGAQFLSELPLPYPSYYDPDQDIAKELNAQAGFPATAFYDREGKLVFTKLGPYESEAALDADIQKYTS
jgi:cytochrome c biogenesis protein CcmG, thiol:disulfide interchange protein DsbE